MADLKYTVRPMTKDDVPGTLEVWRQTGMQEGTHCLYTWLEVDKEAFNIAVLDSGEVIAACCAVLHHPDFAFVGIYCCLEKKDMMAAVALNAVPGKLELYRDKGGFPIVETRWTSVVNETEEPINHEPLSDQVPDGVTIEPFQEAFLPAMSEYDHALMGYDRKLALELNCKEVDSQSLVGPLYADDAAVAEVILRRLIVSLPKAKGFAMMTISTNIPANDFIKKIGCPTTEECPRISEGRQRKENTRNGEAPPIGTIFDYLHVPDFMPPKISVNHASDTEAERFCPEVTVSSILIRAKSMVYVKVYKPRRD
ncbi:hypothetical protein HNY73_002948 [Argiope bruennichi]|uniref:N-acetyltransferase domain-containing protein n=1 Tax=Argiope bruennichi TaxID=94029 RepID=A0A8T0FWG4_ARGBR|nr:hypothetical protein HNY73_002948 [Argiope bruennichi]